MLRIVLVVLVVGQIVEEPTSAFSPSAEPARAVSLTYIDGLSETGQWLGSADGRSIRVELGGIEKEIGLSELSGIEFDRPFDAVAEGRPSEATPSQAAHEGVPADDRPILYLNDGSRFPMTVLGRTEDGIRVRSLFGEDTAVPLDAIAAIRFASESDYAGADAAFRESLRDRRLGEDQLITRSTADARSVSGRVGFLDLDGGSFVFQDRPRPFLFEKMYAIVLARPAVEPERRSMLVRTKSGAVLAGSLRSADAQSLQVTNAIFSYAVVPVADVQRADIYSERMVYLTELTPKQVLVRGRLHDDPPIGNDRSVAGGELRCGGRIFERGLGLRSFTRLDYTLNGRYETFVAETGIDDLVRPQGVAALQVLGDGRELYDTTVCGSRPPMTIRVDVRGVRELSLIVDYGDGIDVSDYVVCGGARLLKPRERSTGTD